MSIKRLQNELAKLDREYRETQRRAQELRRVELELAKKRTHHLLADAGLEINNHNRLELLRSWVADVRKLGAGVTKREKLEFSVNWMTEFVRKHRSSAD